MLIGLYQKLIEGIVQAIVVSRSTIESVYRAMSQSTCEIMWIHNLLTDIGLKHDTAAKLWCDNQVALHITTNPIYHKRIRLNVNSFGRRFRKT